MSVDRNIVYDRLTYIENNVSIWDMKRTFTGDRLAGTLAGLTSIMFKNINQLTGMDTGVHVDYMLKDHLLKLGVKIYLEISTGNKISINIRYDDTSYRVAMSNYYVDSVKYDDIIRKNYIVYPHNDEFGWWIDNGNNESYALYSFKSYDFVLGFIDICNSYNVDFRDYILGPIFKREDGKDVIYNIPGYDIEEIPKLKRVAPVGAFYTGLYESDPNAEDYD